MRIAYETLLSKEKIDMKAPASLYDRNQMIKAFENIGVRTRYIEETDRIVEVRKRNRVIPKVAMEYFIIRTGIQGGNKREKMIETRKAWIERNGVWDLEALLEYEKAYSFFSEIYLPEEDRETLGDEVRTFTSPTGLAEGRAVNIKDTDFYFFEVTIDDQVEFSARWEKGAIEEYCTDWKEA